ncbi:MAG: type II toxin-antitoxin system RelE family toxin [Phycisphaerales bacterium]
MYNEAMVNVTFSRSARKELDALPKTVRPHVWRIVDELEDWPRVSGAKPLRGDLKGRFRKRTGDYRIVFRVQGDTLTIEKIGNRKDVYED